MSNNPPYVEDERGRRIVFTDRKTIAETVLYLKGKPISLDDYRPIHAVYLTDKRHVVICSGRQISKSTTLANFLVTDSIGNPHWESVAVLPSVMQMRRFSNMRVSKVIEDSPEVKKWFINRHCKRNTFERSLMNGSAMYFGAMTQLESLRGLSGNRIVEDEVQDMNGDDLAVVEEALSGQRSADKFIMRTGTAKTVGNLLETTLRESSMCEWIVPCPAGHHNKPSPDNIGDRGFICKRCRSLCDVRNGYWRAMQGLDRRWLGFRIPQIVLPMHTEDEENWQTIVYKKNHTNPIAFLNEVMGQAAGSGITILSEDDLRACCSPSYRASDVWVSSNHPDVGFVFATVDWGLMAIKSFTVLGLWGITHDMRIKLLYAYRFHDPDIFKQVEIIARMCINFGVRAVGADWGMGVAQSRLLEEELRIPVNRFMYVGEQRELMKWDPKAKIWKVNRTQAMTETFLLMKRKTFWFPDWEWFGGTAALAKDILCVYEEAVDQKTFKNDFIRYDHSPETPDDFAHVSVYIALLRYMAMDRGKSEYVIA